MIKTEKVHISQIKAGDVIIIEGKEQTLSKKHISYGSFMGKSIMGYNYKCGYELVERRIFAKWYKGELMGYYAQVTPCN